MAKSRLHKTSVDYVIIGLSPLLIMVLVGSLCFFLLEVFYRGEFAVGIIDRGTFVVVPGFICAMTQRKSHYE